ncbi:MAG: hypothetical protein KDD02_02835 [Phaeodactylibacter sp.]|nr:hypothetical protein [Phaeodactylibacter sp.]MCB9301940.1 hypothetical protein [Lewinellaceae bacterium]HQU59798.1 hypothetical protein [Saprospiraceae bacterium]
MKTLMSIVLATTLSLSLNAQNIWLGGAPGQETEWNNPRNWSAFRAPGPDDLVIIPNTDSRGGFYPVINNKVEPVYFLEVQDNAHLTITQHGELIIDGTGKIEDGLLLLGTIHQTEQIKVVGSSSKMIAWSVKNGKESNVLAYDQRH